MRRILIPALCLLLIGSFAVSADASALSLLFPGDVNKLEDNDYELILTGGDRYLDKGDVLLGIIEIQKTKKALTSDFKVPTYETFTAVVAIECTSVAGSGSSWDFGFGPTTAAWSTFGQGLPTPTAAGTMGMVYSDWRAALSDPFIAVVDGGGVSLTLQDSLETAHKNFTTLMWEIGYDGAPGLFWTAHGDSNDISAIQHLDFATALNVTFRAAGWPLLKHDFLSYGVMSDVQGDGGKENDPIVGPFHIATDGDWYIKPTPEPGSLALLGLGLAACAGMVYRRRRNKA